jgi:hypothetical protein
MRDLLSKITTASLVAGAALLVAACGGTETAETNNTLTELDSTDTMMDGTTNDVTAVDGAMADGNMAMDSNMTMDANSSDNAMGNMAGNMTNSM